MTVKLENPIMPAHDLNFWKTVDPAELFALIAGQDNLDFVASIMNSLTVDPKWTAKIISMIDAGQIETRAVISWLAQRIGPSTYLEVGVRRGFSMAMVAARQPEVDIYAFDLWMPGYGESQNPGPRFVQGELAKVGYAKQIKFFNGDSHKTIRTMLYEQHDLLAKILRKLRVSTVQRTRPDTFDLITIDGDHSIMGAYQDLVDLMPYCSVGGAVVFDDILIEFPTHANTFDRHDPCGWRSLLGVWQAIKRLFVNFRYFEYLDNPPGVGVAIRLE